MITWDEYDKLPNPSGIPDPPVYLRARRARKGWARDGGIIVHGKWTIIATRHYRKYGSAFSGWVVADLDGRSFSDPVPDHISALDIMFAWAEKAEMRS